MRKLGRVRTVLRAELAAALSFAPLLVLSLLMVVALSMSGVAVAYPSFQSPISPPTLPTPTTEAPTAPTEPPAPTAPTEETPSASPEATAPGPEAATPTVPTELTPTPRPEATVATVAEEAPSRFSNLRWATIIDTVVVGFSYLWLCCGAIVLALFVLGVVLSFLVRRS